MSGVNLQGDWSRLERNMERLVRFDFQGLHEEIGEALVSSVQKRFEDEEGPTGAAWAKSIRAQSEGGRTLADSARLKNSIAYKAKPNGVSVGTNVKYAGVHQFGKTIRAKGDFLKFKVGGRWAKKREVTIPARPYLGVSADDEEEIAAIIHEYVEDVFR